MQLWTVNVCTRQLFSPKKRRNNIHTDTNIQICTHADNDSSSGRNRGKKTQHRSDMYTDTAFALTHTLKFIHTGTQTEWFYVCFCLPVCPSSALTFETIRAPQPMWSWPQSTALRCYINNTTNRNRFSFIQLENLSWKSTTKIEIIYTLARTHNGEKWPLPLKCIDFIGFKRISSIVEHEIYGVTLILHEVQWSCEV